MSVQSSGGPPYPPPYASVMIPMSAEAMLQKRNLWYLNLVSLFAILVGFILGLWSGDALIVGFARFVVLLGGLFGAAASLAGALGSKRTTDIQNLGLFVWAGLLVLGTAFILAQTT